MESVLFWSQGPLVNGVRSWPFIIKHDLTHWFYGLTLGVGDSVRVPHRWGHRCWTGMLLESGSTCDWRQKLTIDYKTWFDTMVPWPDTWYPLQCPGSTSLRAPMWNRPTSRARVLLGMVSEVGNWLQNMIWHIGSMAGHLESAPVSRFHIIDCTNVEPAHFWSQHPLVNCVKSWQLITNHEFTDRFHGRTIGVRPSVRVPHRWGHRCGTCPLLEPGSTCEWCRNLVIDYKI